MKYTAGEEKKYSVTAGDYDLKVVDAFEKQSRAGHDMIVLEMETVVDGVEVTDYLTPKAAWRIDQFRKALGEVVRKGEQVELDSSKYIGKIVRASLKTEEFTTKSGGTGTKNVVEKYIEKVATQESDDAPFEL